MKEDNLHFGKEEDTTTIEYLKGVLTNIQDEDEKKEILGELSNLILGLSEYDGKIETEKQAYDDLKKAHDAERSEAKAFDKQ